VGDLIARRPNVVAAVLYAVLALAMFAPGLAPGRTLSASDYLWSAVPWQSQRPAGVPGLGSNQEEADAATQFQPALEATRRALPDVPLWDPYILGGRSFLGDPQSAVLSPFSAPSYGLPFWDSLAVAAALKLFVAAFGAFLLGRALGMRFGGALLSGLVFGFSLWAVTWVSWPHMSVWAFLPWLCLLAEACVRRPGPLPFAGLAAVVGLQFVGGHPASSLQVLLVLALFWLVRTLADRGLRERRGWRLLTLFGAVLTGTALAAVALVPFVELLAHSSDATARADASELLHQPSRYLLGVFLPDYWGRKASALQFGTGLEERAYYVAALPLMLAAVALAVTSALRRVAVALTGAACLSIAAGLPPLYDLVVALPGFDSANNGRFAVITVLCLAVLAGWGLDELAGGRALPRRRVVVGVATGLLALPLLIAAVDHEFGRKALGQALKVAFVLEDPPPRNPPVVKLAAVVEWALLGGAALLLIWLRLRGRVGAAAFTAMALGLVALDLFRAGLGYNPAIPESHAVQPVTPALRYLQERQPARFSALRITDTLALAYPMPPNVAMRYRIQDARGYVIPTEERYFSLWRDVVHRGEGCYYLFCTQEPPANERSYRALALLGVRYLLQHPDDPPAAGLTPVYDGPDARIYRNPAALPRAFLVDRQVVADGADAARETVTARGFPVRAAAVTERPLRGLATGGSGTVSPGSARVADYKAERVVVDTDARRPALLVLTDNWFPGWKARVDGRDVPVERVDYLIRGVAVPAGRHRVEFRYQPASWRIGWIVSLVALLAIVAVALLGWRAARGVGRARTA
jgi:Bacterial membrane protein YfhO